MSILIVRDMLIRPFKAVAFRQKIQPAGRERHSSRISLPSNERAAAKSIQIRRIGGPPGLTLPPEMGDNIMPHWTALATLLAILLYFLTGLRVTRARQKYNVPVPAMTGNPDFERVVRVQMNTLEWMPIFLPLLWLFAVYVSDKGAAALGLVWIGGRLLYMVSYSKAAEKRGPGFGIQALACAVLLLGAAAGILAAIAHGR
jgi:glutathione S-transferase